MPAPPCNGEVEPGPAADRDIGGLKRRIRREDSERRREAAGSLAE